MTMEEYKKEIFNEYSSTKVYKSAKKYIKSLEAQLKAKDEDLKLAMDLSKHMLDELKTERGIKEYLAKELKAKSEEIEKLKEIINTSIEEIEYAIIRPQYVEVYLNNAISFLKDNK